MGAGGSSIVTDCGAVGKRFGWMLDRCCSTARTREGSSAYHAPRGLVSNNESGESRCGYPPDPERDVVLRPFSAHARARCAG